MSWHAVHSFSWWQLHPHAYLVRRCLCLACCMCLLAAPITAVPQLQHAFSGRASSSSGSDSSLTWEVPPVLERTFGPAAEAVGGSAAGLAAGAAAGSSEGGTKDNGSSAAAACDAGQAIASGGSSSRPLSPSSQQPSSGSGLHPLVRLYRQDFAQAADQHLEHLLWQLLQAEEVQQPEAWLPIVLRLVCEASCALLPAAAAAFGEQDPRFYVKVGHGSNHVMLWWTVVMEWRAWYECCTADSLSVVLLMLCCCIVGTLCFSTAEAQRSNNAAAQQQ